MLDENDIYVCFDFEDKLNDFVDDLNSGKFDIKCKIIPFGNSTDTWDSYNYNLSEIILHMREDNLDGFFDVVYLDGAHTFMHDGLAVCLLKQLIKKSGYLILDDLFWKYSDWNGGKPVEGKLPKYQCEDMQILHVQEIFLRHDPNFEKLSDEKS